MNHHFSKNWNNLENIVEFIYIHTINEGLIEFPRYDYISV